MCKSPSSSGHNFRNITGNVYIFVIDKYTEFHILSFGIVGLLEEKLDILVPWELTFIDSDRETSKIKLYMVRALKRYLKKKNLIHGQETLAISKFSSLITDGGGKFLLTQAGSPRYSI